MADGGAAHLYWAGVSPRVRPVNRFSLLLARFLEKPLSRAPPFEAVDPAMLQATLRPGDVLLKINDRSTPSIQEFRKEFTKLRCRSHVTLQVLRGRFLYYVTLNLRPSRS